MDILDSTAFHAAHRAASDLDVDQLWLAIDAYMADLPVAGTRIVDGRTLLPVEAEQAFQPRDVEA